MQRCRRASARAARDGRVERRLSKVVILIFPAPLTALGFIWQMIGCGRQLSELVAADLRISGSLPSAVQGGRNVPLVATAIDARRTCRLSGCVHGRGGRAARGRVVLAKAVREREQELVQAAVFEVVRHVR